VLTLVTGCAALFQDRLKGEYRDTRSEPQCTTSNGWAIVDGILAVTNVLGGLAASSDDTLKEDKDTYLVAGLLWGGVHVVSAISGFTWASTCDEAYARWQAVDPTRSPASSGPVVSVQNDPNTANAFWCGDRGRCTASASTCVGNCSAQERAWCKPLDDGFVCGRTRDACTVSATEARSQSRGECVIRRAARWGEHVREIELAKVRGVKKPAPTPRGHFCASNATSAVCAREKRDCETGRNAALGAVPDLAECTLVETVYCVSEQCLPALDMCQARAAGAECEERK
jgi:hypothetical protein